MLCVIHAKQAHLNLETKLDTALLTRPPVLNASREADADVLALWIETSLLEFSLLRARTHLAMRTHTSPTNPNASMATALTTIHARLREKARQQAEEEALLDGSIEEYNAVLGLINGKDGGFRQIVEDMANVEKEAEECRKDLRRLGWKGD